jgi:hypothetical protein
MFFFLAMLGREGRVQRAVSLYQDRRYEVYGIVN